MGNIWGTRGGVSRGDGAAARLGPVWLWMRVQAGKALALRGACDYAGFSEF